jgi:hypothetical protein
MTSVLNPNSITDMTKADTRKAFEQLPKGGQQLLKTATEIINALKRRGVSAEQAEGAVLKVLTEMKEDIRKGHYKWVMLQLKTILAQEPGSSAKD